MNELEKQWIDRCIENSDKYIIVVDNDCAYVLGNEGECVFEFHNWGWRLALDLFRYIGCNAEEA